MTKPKPQEIVSLRLHKYTGYSIAVAFLLYLAAALLDEAGIFTSEFARNLLQDLSIALVVGIYLMWTLERLNSIQTRQEVKEYIHEVGESFLRAVYGKQLPDELFRVVRKSIFDNSFVRNQYNIEVRLFDLRRYAEKSQSPIKECLHRFLEGTAEDLADRYLIAEFSVYYETENVSDRPSPCPVVWEIPQPFFNKHMGLGGLTSVLVNGKPLLKDIYLENNDPNADPSHLVFEDVIQVDTGNTATVELNYYSVRSIDDKEPWQVLTPCRKLHATLTDHDTNSEVLIWLDAPDLKGIGNSAARKEGATNTARLRVDQYLLPYQGVTFHWRSPHLANGSVVTADQQR